MQAAMHAKSERKHIDRLVDSCKHLSLTGWLQVRGEIMGFFSFLHLFQKFFHIKSLGRLQDLELCSTDPQ